jgi:hypothetical protein
MIPVLDSSEVKIFYFEVGTTRASQYLTTYQIIRCHSRSIVIPWNNTPTVCHSERSVGTVSGKRPPVCRLKPPERFAMRGKSSSAGRLEVDDQCYMSKWQSHGSVMDLDYVTPRVSSSPRGQTASWTDALLPVQTNAHLITAGMN